MYLKIITCLNYMTIKHLVLCGGGPVGFVIYGALKQLHQKKMWRLQDIESIYACSVGSLFGIIIALDFEWSWIDDFFIKRPWNKLFDINNINYLTIFNEKGLLDETYWEKVMYPIFMAKQININITLAEFYDLTKIDIYYFATRVNNIDKVSINYQSHPNMKVITALYITACVPFLFKPCFIENECYIDGGILNNVPINDCLFNNNCDKNEILNFIYLARILDNNEKYDINTSYCSLNDSSNDISNNCNIVNDSSNILINNDICKDTNFFTLIIFFFRKLLSRFIELNSINNIEVENTINVCLTDSTCDINFWFQILNNKDNIKNVIDFGIYKANLFLEAKEAKEANKEAKEAKYYDASSIIIE